MLLKEPFRLSFLCFFALLVDASHHEPAMVVMPAQGENSPPFSVSFSSAWQMLGPFQIGTREATWGADPLEFFGGFRNLQYDEKARFRSSLGTNGTVKWSLLEGETVQSNDSGTTISLAVKFTNAGLPLQSVYGWAALQYQAWARGQFSIDTEQYWPLVVYSDSILEFWIDDVHYFGGDLYSFRKAPPVIRLDAGEHTIDVRLVYDVRAMGGSGEANFHIALNLGRRSLEVVSEGIVMADVVNGSLASSLASVTVRNNKAQDLEIFGVEPSNGSDSITMLETGVTVSAGQTRPILFHISLSHTNKSFIGILIKYKQVKPASFPSFLEVSQTLNHRSIYDPHKITYLHSGSILSYAMLRPPSENAILNSSQSSNFPIILGLHGAGVEAENDMVAHAFDPVPDLQAWVVMPTGVTPWSGDDWHNWGFSDVESAVNYIPKWIEAVGWLGPSADLERWLVVGHSNGGQGTWYALTHRPSNVIAAAPLSGYSSIQNYVPYALWQPVDPQRSAIRDGALNSYRHELLMENCQGIPILQQHGGMDDNVPTYHSRLLNQLLLQANGSSRYYELPGKGHWFDGVMTTPHLTDFYNEHINSAKQDRDLHTFSLVVGNPGDTGPKEGLRVTQLEVPGQYGKVNVVFDKPTRSYTLTTSNVLGLEVETHYLRAKSFVIDGKDILESVEFQQQQGATELCRTAEGLWRRETTKGPSIFRRSGRQLGAMDAILRTSGHFIIRYHQSEALNIALQISRNFFQYFSADSAIIESKSHTDHGPGNIVTVGIGADVHDGAHPIFPIELSSSSLSIRESGGRVREYSGEGGLSAIFLRPLPNERLELVVWGIDESSLAVAARLVPMLTGVGQPDFVVLRRNCLWQGVEGAVAMGFFDHKWNVTRTAVLQ